jgi:hypothetical protein
MLNDVFLDQQIAFFVEVVDAIHEFEDAIGFVGPQQTRNHIVANPCFALPESVIGCEIVVAEADFYYFGYFRAVNEVLYKY